MENQTHKRVLSVNNTNLVELIDSTQHENLEVQNINYKSLIENNEVNGLPVEGTKPGDQHLNLGNNRSRTRKSANRKQRDGKMKLLLPSHMICMSLFLVLSSNTMMCDKVGMDTDTNEIFRKNVKTTRKENGENSNITGLQRIDKRHVSEDKFKAFECSEESDLSTVEFSLNQPPACSRADGSAYYPPEPKKA